MTPTQQEGEAEDEDLAAAKKLHLEKRTRERAGRAAPGGAGRCCCALNTSARALTRKAARRRVRLVALLAGVLAGCLGAAAFLLVNLLLVRGAVRPGVTSAAGSDPGWTRGGWGGARLVLRMPVYVGVLTMDTYLSTRAASCNRTWARDPAFSRVEFFAKLGTRARDPRNHHHHHSHDQGVVNLTDIPGPDFYHTAASFRMLQYICEQHVEQFDWFVRAVDDSYIKARELLTLLSTLDKNGQYYLGHPSLGETELGVAASGGRYFCLGGPGIVLSRNALKGICPHLTECERKSEQAPADVELGRCIHSVLGLQCRRSSQYRRWFHNSYSRNSFWLAEEFMEADSAVSLHPLKTDWLMAAVHRHAASAAITRLSKRLSWLRSREKSLAVSVMSHNTSRGFDTKIEDLLPVLLTVVTSSYKEMNAGTCSPITKMTPAAILELTEAIRVSNASFLYGDNVRCRHLVDGHFLRESPGGATSYVTKMACHNVTSPFRGLLAKAYLKAPHRPLVLRRRRQRVVQSKLVVFLHTNVGDPKLMEFLIMWKNVLRYGNSADHLLILFLVYSQHRHQHQALDMEFALSDLDRWKRDNQLNLLTYTFNNSVSAATMHQMALAALENKFKDAVVLLAQPHLNFDQVFLKKCRFFVRPGKHMYRPYGEQSMIYRHWAHRGLAHDSVTETLWSEDLSPVCIHTLDLERGKKQTKAGTTKRKPLKVISSFDMSLQLDIL